MRLGVDDLRNGCWPLGRHSFNDEGNGSVEPSCEFAATLTSIGPEYLQEVAVEACNGLAAVYGIEAHRRS